MRTTWLAVAILGTAGLAGCDSFSAQLQRGGDLRRAEARDRPSRVDAHFDPRAGHPRCRRRDHRHLGQHEPVRAGARQRRPDRGLGRRGARHVAPDSPGRGCRRGRTRSRSAVPKPTDASADSAYDAGTAKVFQHIIVTPAGTTAADYRGGAGQDHRRAGPGPQGRRLRRPGQDERRRQQGRHGLPPGRSARPVRQGIRGAGLGARARAR